MRDGLAGDGPVSFLASDHLGSTTLTVWANGTVRTEVRYDPWGQERWQRNTNPMPTGYRYTSQRWDSGLLWQVSRPSHAPLAILQPLLMLSGVSRREA